MADRIGDWAGKAFQEIHPKNPLNKLNDSDRKALWALLMVYGSSSTLRRKRGAANDPVERLSRIMADAAKLGAELKSDVFGGPFSEPLRPFTAGFEDIPLRLVGFSKRLGKVLDLLGKRGHKAKIHTAQSLVQASEFVRLKTGQHYDEHLAELFQAIGKRSAGEDLSGDAIRKKRERLKEHYPVLYADAVKWAKREHEP